MAASILSIVLLVLLPTQLGKHFFLPFSYISGVRIDYLAPAVFLTDIIIIAIAILRYKKIVAAVRNKHIVILLLLCAVNVLFAASPPIVAYRMLKLFEAYVVFIVMKDGLLKEHEQLISFIIGTSVQLGLAVWQFSAKHAIQGFFYLLGERYMNLSTPDIAKASLYGIQILRPYGTFSHPNSLAGFYVVLYFFTLTHERFKPHRLLKYTLLFLCSALILLSFSKIAIGTFLILNIVWLVTTKDIDCTLCKFGRAGILIILSSMFFFVHGDSQTLSKRWDLMTNALSILLQHPLTGVGLGNYLYAQSTFPIRQPYFFLQPVHNIFVLFFTEAGLLLGGYCGYLVYNFIKLRIRIPPIAYMVAAVIITGTFDHYWLTLQQNLLLLPLLFALL